MRLSLTDRAEVRGARITRDGYLVADALVARANNIQEYLAGELGLTDRAPGEVVRIFRPESEVFAADSMASAAHRPITIDHPPVMVDAKNWKQYARGEMGDEIARDGEFVRVPVKVMDAEAIESVLADRQEFSMGYGVDLDMTAGSYKGQAYDGSVKNIRYNHLAACRTARGGAELRITDERRDDARHPMKDQTMKTIMIDGVPVADVSPAAEAVITTLQGRLTSVTTAKDAADGKVAELTTVVSTKDAEIATLKTQLADAALTPAKLQDAAKAYALVIGQAKALGATVTDGMDIPAIQAAVVNAKLGDAAKGWTADQIATSFATLAAGVKVQATDSIDPLRQHLIDGGGAISLSDVQAAWQKAKDARTQHLNTNYQATSAA